MSGLRDWTLCPRHPNLARCDSQGDHWIRDGFGLRLGSTSSQSFAAVSRLYLHAISLARCVLRGRKILPIDRGKSGGSRHGTGLLRFERLLGWRSH